MAVRLLLVEAGLSTRIRDEVWAVVAFLQQLPSLSANEDRALATGDRDSIDRDAIARAPRIVRETCSRCHGVDSAGRNGSFPRLAGQRVEYLYQSLRAFADRRRSSGIMHSVATALSPQDMRDAAAYFHSLSIGTSRRHDDTSSRQRGADIAASGMVDRSIPACRRCHGPDDGPKNPTYPHLAGQHAAYLVSQLELFATRRRGGSGYETLMHAFVSRLAPEEMRDVGSYYSGLRGQ